ncbi:MAG: hypothetical protein ACRC92_08770 [Peptostreptococcaceae bacterium]
MNSLFNNFNFEDIKNNDSKSEYFNINCHTLNYYCLMLQKTGEFIYADKIESLLFDANYNSITQIYPYFFENMWIQKDKNLICSIYGSCKMLKVINNVNVLIEEITNYPFDLEVKFIVTTEKPIDFSITFRIPSWAKPLSLNNKYSMTLNKTWYGTEEFTLLFKPNLKSI